MMHHPSMHPQQMSGPPPQLRGPHPQMPHQMHRDARHPPLPRMAMGPSQASGGMGSMGGQGMGGMGVAHHAPPQRPPHAIRAMPHHPQQQHHTGPPQAGMKGIRRGYMNAGYPGPGAPPVVSYTQHPPARNTAPIPVPSVPTQQPVIVSAGESHSAGECISEEASAVQGDGEAARPASDTALANSKEKTPMCLVNELARYNKIKHQYRLTSETGPAHKKIFTVTLRLGETEEYTAEGSSIKRAQHAAANMALSQTSFPAPPPRLQPAHTPIHHRHAVGAVMPTVELNALAMKLCQPAIYNALPPAAPPQPPPPQRARLRPMPPPYRMHPPYVANSYNQRMMAATGLVYRVRVSVGGNVWLGEGNTPQGARHDAAARALRELRPALPVAPAPPVTEVLHSAATDHATANVENTADLLNSDVKSPVSLVHELALKKNLSVLFSVKSERGPPHMRVFVTTCTVGDMETDGEGNGKKVSKRRAAERMLDEMRRRWPPALLRSRPAPLPKRKPQPAKKKTRNLIKENGETGGGDSSEATDNPISRLAMARHAARARSPQYIVVEERGAGRRREFVVKCDAPPHNALGQGPNKKTAKRRAAQNVLVAMDLTTPPADTLMTADSTVTSTETSKPNGDVKRKEGENGTGGELRQPVPGVLLMDYHQRQSQPNNYTGSSESTAVSSTTNALGAKDQLMYLSKLLDFTVHFSDFPKRNQGEYLSLVSLGTEPPLMCHGAGASTELSHEESSRAALAALARMGLDVPPAQHAPTTTPDHLKNATGASPAKPRTISNGITE